ncbi:MAG: class I SAM-dependent methyltransferase [Chloroflexota bacterium]
MSKADRARWDATYLESQSAPFPPPDPLLLQFTPPVEPGDTPRALDLACGLAQNAMWLETQGYQVDAMDISRVALDRAHAEATQRRLRKINFYHVDLETARLPAQAYDLICVFRYLQRSLFPQLRQAVRPGGRIIYQTFNIERLEAMPDANPDYLLQPGELAGYFADWRLLHNIERNAVSQIVAIRPAPAGHNGAR